MGQFKSNDIAGFWAYCIVTGGVPALSANFGVSSITDTGLGILTVTASTSFTSANWCCVAAATLTATTYAAANARKVNIRNASQAAGSVALDCTDDTATTNLLADPAAWHVVGFGAQ